MIAPRFIAGLVLLFALPRPAAAQETLALDRFNLSFGSFVSELGAGASGVGSFESNGSTVDFDRDFDVSSFSNVTLFELSYRPFDRHELRAAWFRDDRSGSRLIDREVLFEGETFPVGAEVAGRLGIRVFDVGYTYWAWLTADNAFGLTLGMVRLDVDASLDGSFTVADLGTVEIAAKASRDLPAPKLGLNFSHAFSPNVRFTADVATFRRAVGSVDGRIWDATIGVEWYPWKHLGVVIRQAYTRIDAAYSRDGFAANADLSFNGTQALLRARW